MRTRCLFLVFVVAACALSVFTQGRTVTNADLEVYRQARLKAEADLRDNYIRLGFRSPEERARRDAESARQLEQVSARLRAERLEMDRLEAEREAARLAASQRAVTIETVEPLETGGYFWFQGRRYRRPLPARSSVQSGYFAGGQFWPTGPTTRPRPMIVRPRRD